VTAGREALALIYQDLLQKASALSYLDGFRVMALLLVVAIPFVWIMKKPQFKSTPRASGIATRAFSPHQF
jgi:hypothetical protein